MANLDVNRLTVARHHWAWAGVVGGGGLWLRECRLSSSRDLASVSSPTDTTDIALPPLLLLPRDQSGYRRCWTLVLQSHLEGSGHRRESGRDVRDKKAPEPCSDVLWVCGEVPPPPQLWRLSGAEGLAVQSSGCCPVKEASDFLALSKNFNHQVLGNLVCDPAGPG